MLRELSVQNLALIEDARVELRPGFCVWTGETGAGKSLLLTAIALVLGGKASAELVRAGKNEARAAAVFELSDPGLRADVESILGGTLDEDSLVLTRRISAQGRSSAHANGLPVPAATLRRLGERLINVHGQRESQDLLEPELQRELLDAHANLTALIDDYRQARAAHEGLRKRRLALIEASERRSRELDLLAFERDELAAADPKLGEYEDLSREAHRLAHSEELRAVTSEGFVWLYEADDSVQAILGRIARRLWPLADAVPELAEVARDLERLAEESRESARTLRRFSQTWGDDPSRLEEIEGRLALYRRLCSRFRCEPDTLVCRLQEIVARLEALERDDTELAGLDERMADAWRSLRARAEELSMARRKGGKSFARAVQSQLKDLGLGDARLTVKVEPLNLGDDPTAVTPPEHGADRVEMVFAPNPGEPPRPLRKIASGGELSRLTLAIKTVLAGADRVPTLIFDEIDAGVGGRLGSALGKKLAALCAYHQILCITHLPQLASYAVHQWVIRKQTERGRTRTTITALGESERIAELAVMLRGETAAEGTRLEVQAMLAEARSGQ